MNEGHIVVSYDSELKKLHQMVGQIKDLAREQLRHALQSLKNKDLTLAEQVIERDEEINRLDVAVDEMVVNLIAKRQPMARDLREILAVGKIVSDLERVGDETRRLGRVALSVYAREHSQPSQEMLADLYRMAEEADSMVEASIRAFSGRDKALAISVIKQDEQMSDESRAALRRLSTYLMEDSRSIGHMVEIVLGLRAVERIAGHGENIARHTLFLINGKNVRHERLEAL